MKKVIATLSEVDESFRSFYEKDEEAGNFKRVDDENLVDEILAQSAKIRNQNSELRNTNTKLSGEVEKRKGIEEKFKGVDLDEVNTNKNLIEQYKVDTIAKSGNPNEMFEYQTAQMKTKFENQLTAKDLKIAELSDSLEKEQTSRKRQLIDGAITKAVTSVSVPAKGAIVDIMNRAQEVFRIEANEAGEYIPVPYDNDRNQPVFGPDASNYMTTEEWVQKLMGDQPHLFAGNSGGSSQGSNQSVSKTHLANVISSNDNDAFLNNLEAIAKGTVTVQQVSK